MHGIRHRKLKTHTCKVLWYATFKFSNILAPQSFLCGVKGL